MSYLEDLIAATQHPDPTQQRFETPPLVDALAEWNQQGNILHPTVAMAVTHCNAILSQASMMWSPPPASLPTAVCDAVLWITQPMDTPKAPPLQQSASSSSWLDRGCHCCSSRCQFTLLSCCCWPPAVVVTCHCCHLCCLIVHCTHRPRALLPTRFAAGLLSEQTSIVSQRGHRWLSC